MNKKLKDEVVKEILDEAGFSALTEVNPERLPKIIEYIMELYYTKLREIKEKILDDYLRVRYAEGSQDIEEYKKWLYAGVTDESKPETNSIVLAGELLKQMKKDSKFASAVKMAYTSYKEGDNA